MYRKEEHHGAPCEALKHRLGPPGHAVVNGRPARKYLSNGTPRPRPVPLGPDGVLAGQISSFMILGETKINRSFRLSSLFSLLKSQPNKGILLKSGTPSAWSFFEIE